MPPPVVDIYRSALSLGAPRRAALQAVLDPSERQRAQRIRIPRAAEQFVVARGLLRHILGEHLGVKPEKIELTFGPHGKPALRDASHPLRFNISHSHGQVIFAVTRALEIGVDIEMLRPQVRFEDLAQRYFSASEATKLMSLPADQRCAAFFTCWTRKEAFIKAKGAGLALPLDQFDVTFTPSEPPAVLRIQWALPEAAQWRLYNVNVEFGYVAALAVEGDVVIHYPGTGVPGL